MSKFDYDESIRITRQETSFAALIMAAMRKADSFNYERLRSAFPDVAQELIERYEAPGGVVAADKLGHRLLVQASTWERTHNVNPASVAELVREELGPDPFDGRGEVIHWIEGTNHVFEWKRRPA